MNRLDIIGCGLISPAGDQLTAAFVGRPDPAEVTGMYEADLPKPVAHALASFSVRAELGRKGTSFFDRRTALTVMACNRALADADLRITDGNRRRTGVVLGTTAGSVKSSVDYAVDTFTQDPPYMVNPALFPNTVMNCAAGQSAIWLKLNGVNATVAGGRIAFLSVLRYCANAFRSQQADYLLAGAVEEFTPHTAWLSHLRRADGMLPGEGGAVFVVRPGDDSSNGVRRPDAVMLAVSIGFCPNGSDRMAAIAGCVRTALARAGVPPDQIVRAASGGADNEATAEVSWRAVKDVLGHSNWERLEVEPVAGDNPTATGALELAALLALHRQRPELDGQASVLVAQNPEGAVGAAVFRGWSRDSHRG